MIRWMCVILALLIVAVSVIECVTDKTPLEQLLSVGGHDRKAAQSNNPDARTVIRIGMASWQLEEFPWKNAIAAYEKDHPDVRIETSTIAEDALNSILLFWSSGYTRYDVIVAWSNAEIQPFIDYNWNSPDRSRRCLAINIRDYLTKEQVDSFKPALFRGCSRDDPETGELNIYEIPWMGEVQSLNYNREMFELAGIKSPPKNWAEVEEVCKKLKGLEYRGQKIAPLSMNFDKQSFFTQNCYIPILADFRKGNIADEKGRLDTSSPEAARVFETMKRWYRAGYISDNCMISDSVEQDLRVLRSAMYSHWLSRGLWAVKDHGPKVIGVAPSPGSLEAGSLVATYGCVIPKCADEQVKKLTAQFCYETFCTDKYGFQSGVALGWKNPQTGKLSGGGKMPVTKEQYERPDMSPQIVELGKALDKGYAYPDPANFGHVADIIKTEFQKYLGDDSGKITPESAIAAAHKRIAVEVYKEE